LPLERHIRALPAEFYTGVMIMAIQDGQGRPSRARARRAAPACRQMAYNAAMSALPGAHAGFMPEKGPKRVMSSVFYTLAQITQWLGSATIGQSQQEGLTASRLNWQDQTVSGEVLDPRLNPYEYQVKVDFQQNDYALEMHSRCSCPARQACTHVAALLLENLQQQVKSKPVIRPELLHWLDDFRARCQAPPANAKKSSGAKTRELLVYVVDGSWREFPDVVIYKAQRSASGAIKLNEQPWLNVEAALIKPPKFVSDADLVLLRALWLGRDRGGSNCFTLRGASGAQMLQLLLESGRAYADEAGSSGPVPLRAGAPRPGRIEWQPHVNDRLRPALCAQPAASMAFALEPPCYVDTRAGEAGLLELSGNGANLAEFLAMPSISLAEAPLVGAVLSEIAPQLPLPPAHDAMAPRLIDCAPVPVLLLNSLDIYRSPWNPRDFRPGKLDFASLCFDYDEFRVSAHQQTTLQKSAAGELVLLQRDSAQEQRWHEALLATGLRTIPAHTLHGPQLFPAAILGLTQAEDWPAFVHTSLPALRRQGWRVVMAEGFRFNVIEIEQIDGELRQGVDGWFDVEMGISVDQRTVRLEPLLAELFQRDARWLDGALESIADDETIELKTERGERLRFRAARLKPLVRVLVDLFEVHGGGPLRIAEFDAGRLQALNDTGRWQFHGDETIRQLAQRLRAGPGVQPAPIPRGLQAALRDYQHQGLSWMQFLREHRLSGVLADDMGLGKTVQTLAHILLEKESGRLDRPALIVVPTTLVHNWREEARRFTPDLQLLDLNGPQRKERFELIATHDLILTTYPLLWRDQKVLMAHDYHLLILDESQYVKNASTKAAGAIRKLRARHRLCLTGTPLENHLGELWSQFDFLLPGFLGSQKDFAKQWRTPIEKNGDNVRRELLARRIRPFMLRRRKDEVATELPAKTVIVRSVELEGAQRDLYETVRAAMQQKVRDAIDAQGLGRSHIIVLDALLKLRQVCCDPRLVKLEQAAGVPESAKLELLLNMLPELIAEGRRILLFSQFTGMLALIGAALEHSGIPYVLLTGDSNDRVTPVERFQRGEVPLFLISLKAGGVGLNLTAADTVIHYDPWWNPAAENQATDRAHRLGQDKPVFVYKLIAAGSIEEKIVALQEKKALLADSILSEDGAQAAKFSPDDLEALFMPIPDVDDASLMTPP